MSEFQIDFENDVARCEFRPATAKKIAEWVRRNPETYGRAPKDELALELGELVQVGKAKKMRLTTPVMQSAVRYLVEAAIRLSNNEKLPIPFHEIALKVVNAIGFGLGIPKGGKGGYECDRVDFWKAIARDLMFIFQGKAFVPGEKFFGPRKEFRWPHPAAQLVGDIGVFLVPDQEGRPIFQLKPASLQEALKLCAAMMMAKGTAFRNCEHCNTPFLSGGEGRGGGKRRGDARFCSDECRWRHHNEVRRKTKQTRRAKGK
jgi:hypothetical protein